MTLNLEEKAGVLFIDVRILFVGSFISIKRSTWRSLFE